MKRGMLFRVFAIFLSGLLLNIPVQGLAQANVVTLDAKSDAEFDAEDDVNAVLWFAAGGVLGVAGSCLLGAVAIGGAYIYQPVPPGDRLLGKSANYVTIYTDVYKARSRRLQLRAATQGVLSGSAIFFLLGMLNIEPWENFIIW